MFDARFCRQTLTEVDSPYGTKQTYADVNESIPGRVHPVRSKRADDAPYDFGSEIRQLYTLTLASVVEVTRSDRVKDLATGAIYNVVALEANPDTAGGIAKQYIVALADQAVGEDPPA